MRAGELKQLFEEGRAAEVGTSAFLVFLAIAALGPKVQLTRAELAQRTGLSVETIKRVVPLLETKKWVRVERRGGSWSTYEARLDKVVKARKRAP